MNYNTLESLISQEKSINQISLELNKSKSNVRYWLRKYGLTSSYRWKIEDKIERICPRCKTKKPISDFYNRRNKKGASVYCKPCVNAESVLRLRRYKELCVSYKGGSCFICGYSKCVDALDFHHRNPTEKIFGIADSKGKTFNEKIKKELDKCDLLCSNCHRETHAKINLVLPSGLEPETKNS